VLQPASTPRRSCGRQRRGVRSGGDTRAEAAAEASPSPTCPPRGEQGKFMALSACWMHAGWTCSARPLDGAPGTPPQAAPNLLHPSVLMAKLVHHPLRPGWVKTQ